MLFSGSAAVTVTVVASALSATEVELRERVTSPGASSLSVIVSVAEFIVSPVELPDTVTLSPVPSSSVSSGRVY